ncbi:MAG TPA: glycosyltransferase [Pedococcus sp.]|nr:glycosyltransferase [Pedococcus sp.]
MELARSRPVTSAKAWLRGHFGLWPLLELRNRLIWGPNAAAWRLFEWREVRRLSNALGPLPETGVTTIIPTYRRPELLPAAVASALGQTVTDHLVVVVDDGGGGLPELPQDDRLIAISLSRNTRRLGLVRNVGIRLTRSTYIAFLDDDNQWQPNHLAVATDALDDGADLVYTAVERVRSDGSWMDTLSQDFDRRALGDRPGFVDANAIVVRRDAGVRFSVIRRGKEMLPKEDLEFVWRMSARMRVRHVSVPTVRYLVNENSYYTGWAPDPRDGQT